MKFWGGGVYLKEAGVNLTQVSTFTGFYNQWRHFHMNTLTLKMAVGAFLGGRHVSASLWTEFDKDGARE